MIRTGPSLRRLPAPSRDESAVERMLRLARRRLERLAPSEAARRLRAGDVLVDIRPEVQRRRDGELPGAIVICRNVLEWRCDPGSEWRDERVTRPGRRLILICNEGCQSSLAAATVQELGCRGATDVVGGFVAWRAAGLPVLGPAQPR
jgi:rhodanese-related sulfurtransferase